MLRHAKQDQNEQNMILYRATGDFNVNQIFSALQSDYREKSPYSASIITYLEASFWNTYLSPTQLSTPDHNPHKARQIRVS